jgi:uncharacterized protein YoxC
MKKYLYIIATLIFALDVCGQADSISSIKIELEFSKLNSKFSLLENEISLIIARNQAQFDSISNNMIYLENRFVNNQFSIDSLNQYLMMSLTKIDELENSLSNLKKQLDENVYGLKQETIQLGGVTASLSSDLISSKEYVSKIATISKNNTLSISTVNEEISNKQKLWFVLISALLIVVLSIYLVLSRRQTSNAKRISLKQQEIFEKQIEDGQKLMDWLSSQSNGIGATSKGEIDHSFAKRVADEIVRITINLSRMDSTIKGFKQLSASVRKLEQSLNSNGYELENLLNKPYNEGMNVEVNFVTDENLSEGESVITRIIKPQINFKGKLIQAAQVEVSQGE